MKNNICIGLLLLTSILFSHSVVAQDDEMNEAKYWFYRHRLLTEFLASGEANCGAPSGLNIPCDKGYMKSDTTDEFGNKYDAQFKYGDGVSFLGYYIGVLATEFKLLSNNSAPQWQKDKVKEELYFAMKAFERLDKNAETIIPSISMAGSCENNHNGFFLRDDAPASYNDNGVVNKASTRELNEKYRYKINREIRSDFGDNGHKSLEHLSGSSGAQLFTSQDQVADVTLGFALVIKLMSGESWMGYDFKQKAKENVNSMFSYLKNSDFFIPIPGKHGQCEQSLDLFGWSEDLSDFFMGFPLLDEANFNPGISVDCLVRYGALESRINAYAIAQAGNIVFNEKMGAYDKFGVSFKPTTYDTYISSLLKPVWDKLNYPTGKGYFDANRKLDGNDKLHANANDYNNAIIATMAALGNSWEVGFKATKVFDHNIVFEYGPCFHDETFCLPFGLGCATRKVPDFPPSFNCPISFGRAQVWCYSMPNDYLSDAYLYTTLANSFRFLGKGFTSNLHTLLTANGILDLRLCAPIYNPSNNFSLPDITYNMTAYALSEYGDQYGTQLFTLLHRVLHDGKGDYVYDVNQIEGILNSAPCNGPHYKPYNDPHVANGDEGIEGWRNDNRFQKTVDATKRSAANASFPGLDYMLFYNLYQLAHGTSTSDGYKNQMSITASNVTYPKTVSTSIIGSDITKQKYSAFTSIVSDNMIVNAGSAGTQNNGNVSIKAGESIKITNLSVKQGANFKASIERTAPCQETSPRTANSVKTHDPVLTDEQVAANVAKALEEGFKTFRAEVLNSRANSYEPLTNYLSQQGAKGFISESKNEQKFSVKAYPNPIDNILTISCTEKIGQVIVYDQVGNEVIKAFGNGQPQIQIQTGGMPFGVYFVKVISGDNSKIEKVVKMK